MRSTTEVFLDHLLRRLSGDVDGDIAANYAPEVVMLTGSGIYRGADGVRACADELARLAGLVEVEYTTSLVEGEYAFLEWTARGESSTVSDGADSFVVRDGLIVMQSVHYTPQPPEP